MMESGTLRAQVKHQRRTLVIIIVMGICLVMLEACRWPTPSASASLPTLQPGPRPRDLPDFLIKIYPPPDTPVLQENISAIKNTWAVLELDEVAEPGEILSQEELQDRVEFLIDGELRNIEIMTPYLNTPTQAAIIGKFALSVGEHKATVRVHKTSGQVLEHSWTFTVWAEEPAVPGLPEWLQFVRPLPDSIITMQEYQEAPLLPVHYYYPFSFADLRRGICIGVQTSKVVEFGENLDCSGILRKFSLATLDGIAPDKDIVGEGGCELVKFTVMDEEGQVISSYPGPHAYLCWRAKLAPGMHEITVQLERTSGEVLEYTWRFTIVDD